MLYTYRAECWYSAVISRVSRECSWSPGRRAWGNKLTKRNWKHINLYFCVLLVVNPSSSPSPSPSLNNNKFTSQYPSSPIKKYFPNWKWIKNNNNKKKSKWWQKKTEEKKKLWKSSRKKSKWYFFFGQMAMASNKKWEKLFFGFVELFFALFGIQSFFVFPFYCCCCCGCRCRWEKLHKMMENKKRKNIILLLAFLYDNVLTKMYNSSALIPIPESLACPGIWMMSCRIPRIRLLHISCNQFDWNGWTM